MHEEYSVLLHALSTALGSQLKAVVLFGSRARDEASQDSDHDIFIVADGLNDDPLVRTRQVRGALRDFLADLPGAMNLHAKTPAEFEGELAPLYLDVCVDGICLWGSDYFEPLREKGLAALAASGMERKRIAGGLFWMFPDGGARHWELTWEGYRERP